MLLRVQERLERLFRVEFQMIYDCNGTTEVVRETTTRHSVYPLDREKRMRRPGEDVQGSSQMN